ncbi:hypothetical protein [Alkalihalobacillus sp. TS-13]|uniref:hypothetical protein n=1 Tax=Alkalihalobacillus sp. TS-13 TaxID=2842455 RepID=UPI001C86802A|nr:hypothetical protein [Alkalihalobacillus sp. TS-13]
MKRIQLFSFILVLGLFLGACGSEENQENNNDSEQSQNESGEKEDKESEDREPDKKLSSEVENFLGTVESMETTLDQSSEDIKTINENGKTIEEEWDLIEKTVEENHPEHYEKVEESLYPLINESQKDKPDVEKVKELTRSTIDSLKELQQNVEEG